jgi:hypothetical protein
VLVLGNPSTVPVEVAGISTLEEDLPLHEVHYCSDSWKEDNLPWPHHHYQYLGLGLGLALG